MNLLTAADIIAGVKPQWVLHARGTGRERRQPRPPERSLQDSGELPRELCTGTLSLLPSWIQSNLPLLEYFGKDGFENKVCLFSSTVGEVIKVEIAL
jgi:hypothetical protein